MNIDKYRQYIDNAHNLYFAQSAQGICRYWTFLSTCCRIDKRSPIIVELGTIRSFCTDPRGAMKNDLQFWKPDDPSYWDWGSGLFSLLIVEELDQYNPIIHTVDISGDNINICKTYTQQYSHRFQYHTCGSTDFLLNHCPKNTALIYMDHSNDQPHSTQELHLQDAQIIVEKNLLLPGGLILIDDCGCNGWKRCQLSLPYLLNNGFKIVENEYQILLEKQ